jgi:signal transduction histidine kinase
VASSANKTEGRLGMEQTSDLLVEYDSMIEELRKRLNVLSTSLFLLDETSKPNDPKLQRYLKNINREMEKIRQIISSYPKNHR